MRAVPSRELILLPDEVYVINLGLVFAMFEKMNSEL
jgi:hypothetical protein